MPRKIRNPSPSAEFSPKSSAANTSRPNRNCRKIAQHNYYSDGSPSPYESNRDESDQLISDNASYVESDSVTNPPVQEFAASSKNFELNLANHSNSYINSAPLPIFRGYSDECPVSHLSRFTKVCRANNASSIDMMIRIFPVTLENEAALWYDLNIEPFPSLSWDEIKSSFLQAYQKIELTDQLRSKLKMINQAREETVRSYFLRMQWILKRWPDHGIPANLLKAIFVDGLREDFRDWIVLQKPDSLVEALKLAFAFEQVKSAKESRQKNLIKCGFCEGPHEESDCEVVKRMRALWRTKGGGESSYVPEGEEAATVGKKKRQCQCWKKFEKNISFVSRNSSAG